MNKVPKCKRCEYYLPIELTQTFRFCKYGMPPYKHITSKESRQGKTSPMWCPLREGKK